MKVAIIGTGYVGRVEPRISEKDIGFGVQTVLRAVV